jgi:hypothetical protein
MKNSLSQQQACQATVQGEALKIWGFENFKELLCKAPFSSSKQAQLSSLQEE